MNYIIVNDGKLKVKIPLTDIVYMTTIEKKPHVLRIITNQRDYQIYGQLKDMAVALQLNFYRCHRKYLVNIAQIKGLDKVNKKILFFNQDVEGIECSRRYFKELELLWQKH